MALCLKFAGTCRVSSRCDKLTEQERSQQRHRAGSDPESALLTYRTVDVSLSREVASQGSSCMRRVADAYREDPFIVVVFVS